MKCKTLHKKLIFYLEGDLPSREMESVKNHLSECSECAAFAEELQKTFLVLQAEKSPEINPFFYTRLKARLENRESISGQFTERPAWARVLQPVFFTFLLLIGIYTGYKIGWTTSLDVAQINPQQEELIPYLNEMDTEPLEAFLME